VIVRVVEEVAFDAPSLVVNLPPHGARLHINLPTIELQRADARLGQSARPGRSGRFLGGSGRPGIAFAIENFFAVERHRVVVRFLNPLVDLAFAEIKLLDNVGGFS
jgi:hypothetical protein